VYCGTNDRSSREALVWPGAIGDGGSADQAKRRCRWLRAKRYLLTNYTLRTVPLPFSDSNRLLKVKILALETTDLTGSVAASIGPNVLLELDLYPERRSAQSLAPAIKSLLEQVEWKPADVELVAVTVGPGSFTGLRVGVTTAKTFAYAATAEILGIDTLDTIAANLHVQAGRAGDDVSLLEVILDAQRGEIVAGSFARSDDDWFRPTSPQRLLPIDRFLAELRPGVGVAGPILKKLQARVPPGTIILEERYWHPRAAQVARLAARDHAAGRRDDLWTLVPRYSRRSAAEEKLEKA
jgi:tRNA threonylcarbamoyladenosine biosynthesis protein TsaB